MLGFLILLPGSFAMSQYGLKISFRFDLFPIMNQIVLYCPNLLLFQLVENLPPDYVMNHHEGETTVAFESIKGDVVIEIQFTEEFDDRAMCMEQIIC